MKKLFTLCLLGCAATANAQQIPNGGFNQDWETCIPWDSKGNTSTKGEQPTGWIISNVCGISGLGATQVGEKVEDGQGDATPNYSVKLTNTANSFMSSQIIPAYISLGTTWATAVSNITAVNNADGGVFGGKEFTYKPDAIKLYYTRSHGTANTTEKASVIAYLWKGTYTQKDVPGNTSLFQAATTVDMIDRERNILGMSTSEGGAVTSTEDAECIAKLEYYIEGNQDGWKELTIPFEYTSNNTPEKLNVIIAANDYFADRSTIGVGNTLCVDNVSLVYYSQLASLTYADTSVANFDKDTYSYNIDAAYDESKQIDAHRLLHVVDRNGRAEQNYVDHLHSPERLLDAAVHTRADHSEQFAEQKADRYADHGRQEDHQDHPQTDHRPIYQPKAEHRDRRADYASEQCVRRAVGYGQKHAYHRPPERRDHRRKQEDEPRLGIDAIERLRLDKTADRTRNAVAAEQITYHDRRDELDYARDRDRIARLNRPCGNASRDGVCTVREPHVEGVAQCQNKYNDDICVHPCAPCITFYVYTIL